MNNKSENPAPLSAEQSNVDDVSEPSVETTQSFETQTSAELSTAADNLNFLTNRVDQITQNKEGLSDDLKTKLMFGAAGLLAVMLPVYGMMTGDPTVAEHSKLLLEFEGISLVGAIEIAAGIKLNKMFGFRKNHR